MAFSALSARSGLERIGTVAIAAVILIPLVLGGLLTSALATPLSNLDRVTAAIVNDDAPVTINGKSVPLGRQFSAALIAGKSDAAKNFTWVLTNDYDAASGLKSGSYAAVVTIPASFSADATSMSGPAADAKRATIRVDTSPSSAFVDPALTEAITSAATASLNQQLTAQYLSNVYAGFNTLNQQIGQAASGADSLQSGAASVSTGAASLADGAATLSSGLTSLDTGAATLSSGMGVLQQQTQSLPDQTAQLAQGSAAVASATTAASGAVDSATSSFGAVVAQICQHPGALCEQATAALLKLQAADSGVAQLATGASAVASGNAQLADAMPSLVDGIDQAASGATQLASGSAQADSGAASLSTGAASLAQGAAQVNDGAVQLSQGLDQAVTKIPTYSDGDITTLSKVVSQPVYADQLPPVPGSQSVPLFCVIALWLGTAVMALVRKAVPTRQLMATVSSASIAARSIGRGAALGAAQGLVVAPIVLFSLVVTPGQWLGFTVLSMLAGAVFAIVNQGLAAAFGVAGRVLGLFIAIIALTVGLASTVPPVFTALAGFFPTAPALQMLRAVAVGDTANTWLGIGACVIFAVIGFALVFAGVAARRTVRARELSRARSTVGRVSTQSAA